MAQDDTPRIGPAQDVQPVPDWNPWSEEATADPHALQADMRERCPFPFTDQQGGFRCITRYADITRAALDTAHFRNGLKPKLGVRMAPLETDPPEHTAWRRLLQPFFSVARMRPLEEKMRGFAAGLLGPLIAAGSADLAVAFSFILPIRAFCFLLNLPDDDWNQIKSWSRDAYVVYARIPERKQAFDAANAALYAYAHAILADRRAHPRDPEDDIVTCLSQAKINDAPLSDAAIVGVMRLLLTAGHESTSSTLGNCILYLARHPEAQQSLRQNPSAIPAAIEEILRWDTPVMAMPRVVATDIELGGHQFRAGDDVSLLFSSGNRDAAKFENADRCILDRKPNPHLAFGHGVHACIGAPLARIEVKVALEELLAGTGHFELNGAVIRTIFHRNGVTALPLTLTPRRRADAGPATAGAQPC